MKYYLNKINVWSVVKIFFNLFFFFGIFLDIILIGVYGLNGSALPSFFNISPNIFMILYFLFSFAITLGVTGGLFFGLLTVFYNLTTQLYTGIKICVESEDLLEVRQFQRSLEEEKRNIENTSG